MSFNKRRQLIGERYASAAGGGGGGGRRSTPGCPSSTRHPMTGTRPPSGARRRLHAVPSHTILYVRIHILAV